MSFGSKRFTVGLELSYTVEAESADTPSAPFFRWCATQKALLTKSARSQLDQS